MNQLTTLIDGSSQQPTTIDRTTIVIVDDQPLNLQLLKLTLESERDLNIIGFADNGINALEMCQQLRPDVALIDIEMPDIDGITLTQQLSQSVPATKVIIFSSHNSREYIDRAFNAGAKGYLLKSNSRQEIVSAIRFVKKNYIQLGQSLFALTSPDSSAIVPTQKSESQLATNLDKQALALATPTKILEEDDWSIATKELLDTLPRLWTRGLFYFLTIFTAIVLPWSIFTKIDETGIARGKLEPKAKTIQLDAPMGGKVTAVQIKEGDTVKAGQTILELESEEVRSELQQLEEKQIGQLNRLTQLELLQNQIALSLRTQQQQNQAQQLEKQSQVEQARQTVLGLQTLAKAQQAEKLAQIEQVQKALEASNANRRLSAVSLAGAKEKAARYRQAFENGVIPEDRLQEVEQLAKENQERLSQVTSETEQARSHLTEERTNQDKLLQQATSDIAAAKLRLQEQERSYQSLIHSGELALLKTEEQLKDIATQISTLNAEIAQNRSQIGSLEFQLAQRVLKAPANGTVFHLPIASAGKVVQPGEEIVEIAPENTPLVLKAQIAPTESGFLDVGMPVKIKFDAYPFQDYGVQNGRVTWISPDSKMVKTESGEQETFELKIELEKPYIEARNKKIALTPGQTATAEVVIRQRRTIDFVLDPFKKLQKGGLQL
jgi:HlyD family secretion protein